MSERDPAAARFWALQAMRLVGLAMVLVGVTIIAGKLPADPEFGYLLMVLGAVGYFFFPILLKRRWRESGK